jgi:putative transposase
MARRHIPEQIIRKLREAERLAGEGATTAEAAKQLEVSEQTLHRLRAQYGGMKADGAKRLKELEKENLQLKRIVADQALDLDAMREVARGNFSAGTPTRRGRHAPAASGHVGAAGMPGRSARPVPHSATGLQIATRNGSRGRGCGSSPRSVRAGATGVRTSRRPGPGIRATSRRSTVCGVRKACACPRSAGSAAGSVRRPSLPNGASRPDRTMSGRSIRFDTTVNGRAIKLLSIIDEYTRESLAIVVDHTIDADDTVTALEKTVIDRGRAPEFIRCDNGPELTAHALADWCKTSGAGMHYIDPGSP